MKLPVVIVHGYLSTEHVTWPLSWRLSTEGFDVTHARLSGLVIGDVRDHARELGRTIAEVLARTGAPQVDLVGLSQGGLIALEWASGEGHGQVRRVVALGSPVHGSWAARAVHPVLGRLSVGLGQLVPDSDYTRDLLLRIPPDLDVVTVSLAGDPVAPPRRCHIEKARRNVVVPVFAGPVTHQWLGFDTRVLRAVTSSLTASGLV